MTIKREMHLVKWTMWKCNALEKGDVLSCNANCVNALLFLSNCIT